MNPDFLAQLQQYAAIQQMMGGFAPTLPRAMGNPVRIQASNAGDMQTVALIEQLMGRAPRPAPQQTRQQQPPYGQPAAGYEAPSMLEPFTPFGAASGAMMQHPNAEAAYQEQLRRQMGR